MSNSLNPDKQMDKNISEIVDKLIVEALDQPIAVLDRLGRVVRANPAWEGVAASVQGHPICVGAGQNLLEACERAATLNALPQHDVALTQHKVALAQRAIQSLRAVLDHSKPNWTHEFSLNAGDEERWYLLTAFPLHPHDHWAVLSLAEITALKQAQQECEDQLSYLRDLIDASPNLVYAHDGDGTLTLANQALADTLGATPNEVLGKRFLRYPCSPSAHSFLAEDQDVLATLKPQFIPERVIADANGQARWYQIVKMPFHTSNNHTQVLSVATDITERKAIESQLNQSHLALKDAYDKTLEGWVKALELRDKETEGHTLRVTEVTLQIAITMGVNEAQMDHMRRGALLHDIGKLVIPDHILHKAGPLSHEEWAVMKQHPRYAYDWLSPIEFLLPALDIPYCHHEKWDGTGYPRGISGTDIPLAARIFAVVDVWDALSSDRPYRPAWPMDQVVGHIQAESGTHFDPEVVQAFTKWLNQPTIN